jgi:ATP-dependent Lon protease
MFITTANLLDTIPAPLRDRMEIIQLSGYTDEEKLQIAKRYLVPRQLRANAIPDLGIEWDDDALLSVIQGYTRESGVRNLEREIGSVARKLATKQASSDSLPERVTPAVIREYLGRPRFFYEELETRTSLPGVAIGVGVTAVGGDIMFIETSKSEGRGNVTITGQLGDVMRESAQAAMSFVRSRASDLGINSSVFKDVDIHVHVPAGATPKDGPSAGVALTTALVSLLNGVPVREDVAMTGEVTLRGQVLPVGGIKEKALAAHRAGVKTFILPKRNEADLDDLPENLKQALRFVPVETIDEALEVSMPEEFHMRRQERDDFTARQSGERIAAQPTAV